MKRDESEKSKTVDEEKSNQNVDIKHHKNSLFSKPTQVDLGQNSSSLKLDFSTNSGFKAPTVQNGSNYISPNLQFQSSPRSQNQSQFIDQVAAIQNLIKLTMASPKTNMGPLTPVSTPHTSLLKDSFQRSVSAQNAGFSAGPNSAIRGTLFHLDRNLGTALPNLCDLQLFAGVCLSWVLSWFTVTNAMLCIVNLAMVS